MPVSGSGSKPLKPRWEICEGCFGIRACTTGRNGGVGCLDALDKDGEWLPGSARRFVSCCEPFLLLTC
jgi:hypothetical protein